MASTFKIGDTVVSNHGVAKIERIEVVEPGQKENGISVKEFYWSMLEHVIVDLDNGHWAYGESLKSIRQATLQGVLEERCK